MTRLKTEAFRVPVLAAGIAGVLGMAAGQAFAQQQQIPQGWFKACAKQEDVDICNVQNIVAASTGQIVTGISMLEIKGKVNRKIMQITVPSGRLLPPGIGIQVDGAKPQKVDYVLCFPDRCIAETALTDQIVASFKKGSELTLSSVNSQNQANPVKVSLTGFTGAFDGPPMNQSDIEDRQKKLQEFVAKNNQDFAKKLKEEQDKAKAAN